jgi:hypothetical protein
MSATAIATTSEIAGNSIDLLGAAGPLMTPSPAG